MLRRSWLLPFPNSHKQLRILSSKGRKQFLTCTHMAESCWQLGRAGLGVLGRNVHEGGLEISYSSSRKLWFFVFRGLKFHFHRKGKTFVMFLGTFWLQSLCCFALLRKQRIYIVLSKNRLNTQKMSGAPSENQVLKNYSIMITRTLCYILLLRLKCLRNLWTTAYALISEIFRPVFIVSYVQRQR